MPGEAGWNIGLTGWLPTGNTFTDKGHAADFTSASKLQLAGKSKGAVGAEIGIAAGLHNSIRISYFNSKLSGTTTAPNDLVIFSQGYLKGDELSTNANLTDYKISYEYLTWPYPAGGRHFRLKTSVAGAVHHHEDDFRRAYQIVHTGQQRNLTDYSARGSKSYITPAFGLGFHEYASRNFRFEANASGFGCRPSLNLLDTDAMMAYRAGKIELRAGGKGFLFRTRPRSDYLYRGSTGGLFVGLPLVFRLALSGPILWRCSHLPVPRGQPLFSSHRRSAITSCGPSPQDVDFFRRKLTPLADRQFADPDRTDRRPYQFQYLAFHRLQHAPHLTVASLGDRDFQEGVFLAIAQVSHHGGTSHSVFQFHALSQPLHLFAAQSCGRFDLISLRHLMIRIGQSLCKISVVGHDQQAAGVQIQASDGRNP